MFPGYLAELGEGKTNRMKANCLPKTQERVNDRTFPLKSSLGQHYVTGGGGMGVGERCL